MKDAAIATFALLVSVLLAFAPGSSVAAEQANVWDRAVERARETQEARRRRETRESILKKKLLKPVLVHFSSKPLREAIAELGKLADLKIAIDPKGLAVEGIGEDMPVSLDLRSEIMVRSCLNLIVGKYHLVYYLEGDIVQVTSEKLSLDQFEEFDVTDLGEEMITFLVAAFHTPSDSPEQFRVCRESGKVKFIVRRSDEKGDELADLLKQLHDVQQKHEPYGIQVGP